MPSWGWLSSNGVVTPPILWLVDVHTGIVPCELLARLNALVFSGELSGSIIFQVINVIPKFWHLDWRMGEHSRGLEGSKDFKLQYHKCSLNQPRGRFCLLVARSVYVSVPLPVNIEYAQMVRISVYCHKKDCRTNFFCRFQISIKVKIRWLGQKLKRL